MRNLIVLLVSCFCLNVIAIENEESVNVSEVMRNALEKVKSVQREVETDEAIVENFYNESPSNSSFIVRKELTNTQKRFLMVGRNMTMLMMYVKQLEERIATLEAKLEKKRWTSAKVSVQEAIDKANKKKESK